MVGDENNSLAIVVNNENVDIFFIGANYSTYF